MRKKLLFLLIIYCFFTSCNNHQNNISPSDSIGNKMADTNVTKTETNDSKGFHCYLDTSNKDSIFLHINILNNIVTGDLKYKIYGKDANAGTIEGEMKNDTLIADYRFMSEGKQSVRQVAFLKKDNSFVEGFGAVEEKNDKTIFKNTSSLKFTGFVLKEVDCK